VWLRSSRRICAELATVPTFSFSAYRRRRPGVDGATVLARGRQHQPAVSSSASQLCCARKAERLRTRVRENTTVPGQRRGCQEPAAPVRERVSLTEPPWLLAVASTILT
jgi:hypothetical protein